MKLFQSALRLKGFRFLYAKYKQSQIYNALKEEFNPLCFRSAFGKFLDERIVEYPWFFARLPQGGGRLLDAGSVINFSYLLSHPKVTEKDLTISTLAPEKNCYASKKISYVYEDMRDTCFKGERFDYIVCLSTLEHVGLDNTKLYTVDSVYNEASLQSYIAVIDELHRVLKPGGTLYLSMPFGEHVDHGWLQVFDGYMVDGIIGRFNPSSHEETYFKYFDDGWRACDRFIAEESHYFDVHSEGGGNAPSAVAAESVVLLELVK